MMARQNLSGRVSLLLTLVAGVAACNLTTRKGPAPVDMRAHAPIPVYPALHDSIGEYCVLSSNQDLRLEGYGLVVELPGTGSSEMPTNVRNIIASALERPWEEANNAGIPSPDAILNSNRVSAVEVRGIVPALAPKNTVFDLTVSALPGSPTSSLKYGILWPTELRVIGLTDEDSQSKEFADGRGPIYFEFVDDQPAGLPAGSPVVANALAPQARNMRKARVIGGGITLEDMPSMFQLFTPSLHIVQSVQREINFKFIEKPAVGASEAVLNIMIPQRYRSDPHRFIELCENLFLTQETAGFAQHKAQELLVALTSKDPQTPYRKLSVALEGLGTEILNSHLRPNYLSPDPNVRYYTARAGAAMNDVQAIVVLQNVALDPTNPLRIDAVNELAADSRITNNARAMMALTDLLNAPETQVRLAAYRGLMSLSTPAITHVSIPRKFDLDLVESNGPPMIYITQSGLPRIALIGHEFKLPNNALYVSKDDYITVDCKSPADFADFTMKNNLRLNGEKIPDAHSTVIYYRGSTGDQTITLTSVSSLAAVITRLAYSPDPNSPKFNANEVFAGIGFQRTVEMIQDMVKSHMINATVYMEGTPPLMQTINDLAEQARPEGLVYQHPTQAVAPALLPVTKTGS